MTVQSNLVFFDRQMRVPSWDQSKLDIHCLVLGVGGYGTHVAMQLCRIGVRRLTLVDFDRVESSNLNRQMLFGPSSIGKPKVEVALQTLLETHALITQVDGNEFDIARDQKELTRMVKKADVTFACIDPPLAFLTALICYEYRKPMFTGGTTPQYGHTFEIFVQGTEGRPCYECMMGFARTAPEMEAAHITKLEDKLEYARRINEMQAQRRPPRTGASVIYTAATASSFMVMQMVKFLNQWQYNRRIIMNLLTLEILKFDPEARKGCFICGRRDERSSSASAIS